MLDYMEHQLKYEDRVLKLKETLGFTQQFPIEFMLK